MLDSTIDGKLLKFGAALSLDETNWSPVSVSRTFLSAASRKVIFLVSEGVEHITAGSKDIATKEST